MQFMSSSQILLIYLDDDDIRKIYLTIQVNFIKHFKL